MPETPRARVLLPGSRCNLLSLCEKLRISPVPNAAQSVTCSVSVPPRQTAQLEFFVVSLHAKEEESEVQSGSVTCPSHKIAVLGFMPRSARLPDLSFSPLQAAWSTRPELPQHQ